MIASTQQPSGSAGGSYPRVMYVDDDPDLLNLVTYCFCALGGAEITTCSNSQNFKDIFRSGRFEVLLLDWQMPGLTGLDLARWVRIDCADDKAIIVLVTARDLTYDQGAIEELGIAGVIPKPFDPLALHTQTRELHSKAVL